MSKVLFGRFEFLAQDKLVLADGVPVPIRNRAFDVLRVLVQARNHVVSKADLIEAAWPGRVVEENNLSVQISELRKVLGSEAIRTVAGHGYGLAVPVRWVDASPSVPAWSQDTAVASTPTPDRGGAAIALDDDLGTVVLLAVILDDSPARSTAILPATDLPAGALRALLMEAGEELIQRHGGRGVNHSSSVCLVEFATAPDAAACAFALQHLARERLALPRALLRMAMVSRRRALPASAGAAADRGRMLANAARDEDDIQTLVRLARSANPGELRTDGTARDLVVDGLDCVVEELDEALSGPGPAGVTAVRLSPCTPADDANGAAAHPSPLKPLLAILPFESRQAEPTSLAIGELIADGLIALLSHSRHHWRLVSRLSATAFRGRDHSVSTIGSRFGAAYVVSGSYVEHGGLLMITMQVADCSSGEVMVARRMTGDAMDLLVQRSELLESMVAEIQGAIFGVELQRLGSAPMPALRSYTLLLSGIQLLHRSSPGDFDRSFQVLDQLSHWHPEAIEPRIWQAKWYALRAVQGRPVDLEDDAREALRCTRAALEVDPDSAFALAMEGFVHVHLTRDMAKARECLQRAVSRNPSETFAHLFNAVAQGTDGDFETALLSHDMARSTSPLDPARYLIDTIGAFLHLGCGHLQEAVQLAKSSLRLNAHHAHSWRILAVAQQELGELAEARNSVQRVLRLQPDLTVRRYLANARPSEAFRFRFAQALQAAGLPPH